LSVVKIEETRHRLGHLIKNVCVATVISCALAQDSSHKFDPRSFTLRLDVQPKSFKLGSSVVGKLTLTNTSKVDIDVFMDKSRDYYPSGFNLHVKGADGKSLVEHGIRVLSGGFLTLKPGEKAEYTADLSSRFKFDKPGNYTVHASMDDNELKEMVASNEVTLIVTDN